MPKTERRQANECMQATKENKNSKQSTYIRIRKAKSRRTIDRISRQVQLQSATQKAIALLVLGSSEAQN